MRKVNVKHENLEAQTDFVELISGINNASRKPKPV